MRVFDSRVCVRNGLTVIRGCGIAAMHRFWSRPSWDTAHGRFVSRLILNFPLTKISLKTRYYKNLFQRISPLQVSASFKCRLTDTKAKAINPPLPPKLPGIWSTFRVVKRCDKKARWFASCRTDINPTTSKTTFFSTLIFFTLHCRTGNSLSFSTFTALTAPIVFASSDLPRTIYRNAVVSSYKIVSIACRYATSS